MKSTCVIQERPKVPYCWFRIKRREGKANADKHRNEGLNDKML